MPALTDQTIFTVPSGHKYELREFLIGLVSGPASLFVINRLLPAAFNYYTDRVTALQTYRLVLNTVLYQGSVIQFRNLSAAGNMTVVCTVVDVTGL